MNRLTDFQKSSDQCRTALDTNEAIGLSHLPREESSMRAQVELFWGSTLLLSARERPAHAQLPTQAQGSRQQGSERGSARLSAPQRMLPDAEAQNGGITTIASASLPPWRYRRRARPVRDRCASAAFIQRPMVRGRRLPQPVRRTPAERRWEKELNPSIAKPGTTSQHTKGSETVAAIDSVGSAETRSRQTV